MPIYDYICKQCFQQSELIIIPPNTPVCPYCGSTDLDKYGISVGVTMLFKGTGWGGDKPKEKQDG